MTVSSLLVTIDRKGIFVSPSISVPIANPMITDLELYKCIKFQNSNFVGDNYYINPRIFMY